MQVLTYEAKTKQRPAKAKGAVVKMRPRNAMMDKVVKDVATNPKFSFEAVCKTIGEAMEKSKAKA